MIFKILHISDIHISSKEDKNNKMLILMLVLFIIKINKKKNYQNIDIFITISKK